MIQSKEINKVDSILLSEYILESGGSMSHLKLQKLLFYVDAFHLAFFGQALIDDEFEAWLHGPVSRKVYDSIKGQSILYTNVTYQPEKGKELPSTLLFSQVTEDQLGVIDDVVEEYGKLSSLKLEALTHSEYPWIFARQGYGSGDRCNAAISKEVTREYYKEQLYGDKEAKA